MENQSTAQAESNISCSHCNYNLTGLDLKGSCPECGNKIISTCFSCDYELSGLDPSGVCPECGFTIEGSIGRGELARADPEYLAKLHKGVFVIQTTIIVSILVMFATIGISIAAAGAGGGVTPLAFNIIVNLITLVLAFAMIYGWWLFSSEDPNYTGHYTGTEARKLIRIMIVAGAVFTLLNTVFSFFPNNGAILIATMVIGLIAFGVSIVRYFAEMVYVKWMAPLIRNKKVYNRAKLLMWLGPVLMTVGLLLVGLGPLIALVLYWNMLDWVRKDLKAIRQSNLA